MLERLLVRGLGIIDAVEVELAPGFVALTGETGAGKSLLVTSLELLAGRRATSELVRTGDDRLVVEGSFSVDGGAGLGSFLDEIGVDGRDELILRRELTASGRGRCWINDAAVTVGTLQRLAPYLVSIHGQHEQHGLSDPDVQRRIVDDSGDHDSTLEEVAKRYSEWRDSAEALEELESARANRRDRLDTIAYQIGEIDAVGPSEGEHERLTARRKVLRNATRIRELGASILSGLDDDDGSAVQRIARGERDVEELVSLGLPLSDGAAGLAEARIHLEELVREVRGLTQGVDGDPGELDDVESRLHTLDNLMLKYGEPLERVLEHRRKLAAERAELEKVEDRLDAAAAQSAAALEVYADAADRLDRVRHRAGEELAREVEAVLARLKMAGTTMSFRWAVRADESSPLTRDGRGVAFDSGGVEECELLISANPGEEPRPMAKIASGGELSRIHLAIRSVLRSRRSAASMTLLFDEVDSGLGGATAASLATLLADLARTDQVLAVTHLPQVAAGAGSHFRIEKVDEHGRAVTRVTALDGEDRELEVARMIAGDELGPSARAHAQSLLGES
jgi:DNA repair protein RecN (Recombination protein N)